MLDTMSVQPPRREDAIAAFESICAKAGTTAAHVRDRYEVSVGNHHLRIPWLDRHGTEVAASSRALFDRWVCEHCDEAITAKEWAQMMQAAMAASEAGGRCPHCRQAAPKAERHLSGQWPTWRDGAGADLSEWLYGEAQLRSNAGPLVVCEGFSDCWAIDSVGRPALASRPRRMSKAAQRRLVTRASREGVIVAFDADMAGLRSLAACFDWLVPLAMEDIPVFVARYGTSTDAAEAAEAGTLAAALDEPTAFRDWAHSYDPGLWKRWQAVHALSAPSHGGQTLAESLTRRRDGALPTS